MVLLQSILVRGGTIDLIIREMRLMRSLQITGMCSYELSPMRDTSAGEPRPSGGLLNKLGALPVKKKDNQRAVSSRGGRVRKARVRAFNEKSR